MTYPKSPWDAIPPAPLRICETLQTNGFQAHVVGGCVRDMFMGRIPKDYDITTSATPDQVMKIWAGCIPTGIEHGTVTLVSGGVPYEITTWRADGKYTDGRRPDGVVFTKTIEEDLQRRDFTMNSIAYDPIHEVFVDPFNGARDIACRLIRTVGDPLTRFSEDGLRCMRAIRFAATLEFHLDEATFDAIAECRHIFRKVSVERIYSEMLKLLAARKPSDGLFLLEQSEMIDDIFPGLMGKDLHTYQTDQIRPDPVLRLARYLFPMRFWMDKVNELLLRLKMPSHHIKRITVVLENTKHWIVTPRNDAELRESVSPIGMEHAEDMLEFISPDKDCGQISRLRHKLAVMKYERHPLKTNQLAINGRDIQELLELPPSKLIGEMLDALLDVCIVDPGLNTRGKLIELLPATKKLLDQRAGKP